MDLCVGLAHGEVKLAVLGMNSRGQRQWVDKRREIGSAQQPRCLQGRRGGCRGGVHAVVHHLPGKGGSWRA